MRLLILDNYDSFTYNLLHLVESISDISCTVVQNDKIALEEIAAYDKILLSPGPGLPSNAGIMPGLIQKYGQNKSIFGVCLGLQAIGEAFNCPLRNLSTVFHGIGTKIKVLEKEPMFANCPDTFTVGRYHSWVIDEKKINNSLIVTATDENGLVMAARHPVFSISGVQFHPESILSEHGLQILKNWLFG